MASSLSSHRRRVASAIVASALSVVGFAAQAPPADAAPAPERAIVSMPFVGRWANSYATAPWEHGRTSQDDWSMDIYAAGAPVRPGIVDASGSVSMTVITVDNNVGSCGAGGGVLVRVGVDVDGIRVGTLGYYHLRSVGVTEGQRIDARTVLGRTVTQPGENAGPCWQVSTVRGIHTHFTISGLSNPSCYVRYSKGEQVQEAAPLAVFGQFDDGRPVATTSRAECSAEAATATASVTAFRPVAPTRIFDTRTPEGSSGRIRPGMMIDIDVVPGHDPTIAAVALNVTAVDATNNGYVTVSPSGSPRPLTSNLNLTRGQTTAGLVIVPVGPDGRVQFYTSGGAHIVADLAGVFAEATDAKAGRIVPIKPARLLDTRNSARVASADSIEVPVLGRGGVPSHGVNAVIVNLTATRASAAGYVTAHAAGAPRPHVSNLNPEYAGHTVANLAIVPVSSDGSIELFSFRATDLIVDVTGYVTDASAARSSSGMFIPMLPRRAFDTRTGEAPTGKVSGADPLHVSLGAGGVPAEAAGVFVTVTATQSDGQGYVTAWPTGTERPLASTLNINWSNETRPNGAILPVGNRGSISLVASGGAHLVADVAGWITR